jgi:hypothetical protein
VPIGILPADLRVSLVPLRRVDVASTARLRRSVVMTDRKPPRVRWETWVERRIREGRERGDFDDLPGAGRPIADLDQPRDELWWVKQLLRREQVSMTPPTIAVRRALDEARERIGRATSEEEVRAIVAAINPRIREVNRLASSGPPSTMMPLDVEETVARWRARRDRSGS